MSDDIILFSYFRSSCAWRVRIALEYKGLKYKTVPIQLMKLEQLNGEFLRLNPMGQVPTLIHKGTKLVQSLAILEYLEETYPETPLLPKDVLARAKVREICGLIASGIQPLQNLSVLHKLSDNPSEKLSWAQYWVDKGLQALETCLMETAGAYCVGNEITLADCCLVPQVANAFRFKVNIDPYPTIARINDALEEIEAFQKAHASAQPDCPPEMYSKI